MPFKEQKKIKEQKDKEITFTVLPSQMRVLRSRRREILYSGGFGSGKSDAVCFKIAQQACYPGNQILLVRKTLTSLKNTVLKNLIEAQPDRPAILPKNYYTYFKAENKISIAGGGDIYLTGLEDFYRIRSFNAGCICIDEGIELTHQEYVELMGRLRNKAPKYRQIMMATNPSSKGHWIYKRFYTKEIPGWENRTAIRASSYENIFSPKDYLRSLENMDEISRERYLHGRWMSQEAAIYQNFNREEHVLKLHEDLFTDYLLSVDFGYTSPCGILLIGIYGDNRYHVISELKKEKMLIGEYLKVIEDFKEYEPIVVVDPSAATLIAEIQNKEFMVEKAPNDVMIGIGRVRNKFQMIHQSYALTIDPSCIKLIDELECYHYEPNSEKPVKQNDHLVDALRYAVNYWDEHTAEYETPQFYFGNED